MSVTSMDTHQIELLTNFESSEKKRHIRGTNVDKKWKNWTLQFSAVFSGNFD